MNNLKIVKSLKASFDKLGYAFINGSITEDRKVYRDYLRSGKIPSICMTTDNREFQNNNIYNRYFKNYSASFPSIKLMVHYALSGAKPNKHHKAIVRVTNKLIKLGYLQVIILPDGKLLKDNFNNIDFYYSNNTKDVYRLVNSKAILYKV